MSYEYILFDLDGTLTDPEEGITNSFKYALNSFGIQASREELRKCIGPPLQSSFKDFFGFSDKDTETAVLKYREYFIPKGLYQNKLFDGVPELLESLGEKTLILATSKVTELAEKILNLFEIRKYFEYVSGSEFDGTRSDKAEVIKHAIECTGIKDLTKAIMIGDRKHDIIGAKKNSIASVGILHGFGDDSELRDAGADYIVRNIDELKKLLHTQGVGIK